MCNVYSPYKILLHSGVDRWIKGINVTEPYPITIELHLTNKCDLNCKYCYYKGYREKNLVDLPFNIIKNLIVSMNLSCIKGLIISGGGEPLSHKDIKKILLLMKKNNIKVGLITNGIRLTKNKKLLEAVANTCEWVRITAYKPYRTEFTNVVKYLHKKNVYCKIRIFNYLNLKDNKPSTRTYQKCLITNFIATVSATGDVYPCCMHLGNRKKCIGNLKKKDFLGHLA